MWKPRKASNRLKYWESYEDPADCPSTVLHPKMKSKSVSNCYCGHHDAVSHRRTEEHARKNRKRSTVLTLDSNLNAGEARGSNYITKMATKELYGSGGGKETCSPSPILSPETSNALDLADRIMKDAQLQIAEINANHNRPRYRRNRNLYSEDLPLDDEKEELLYVRERVINKFEETDAYITDYCPVHENPRRYSEDENFRRDPRKFVDLSAPKYTVSGNRLNKAQQPETFQDHKRILMEPVERKNSCTSMKVTDDHPSKNQRTGNIKDISTPRKDFERSGLKMSDKFRIQTGPVLTIERELRTQNLDSIHISPNPSFVKDNSNVGTYEFRYDPYKKIAAPVRKEKFIKIVESKENDINIVNTTTRPGRKEMPDEIRVNSNCKDTRIKYSTGLPKLSTSRSQKNTANSVTNEHPEDTPDDINKSGSGFHENNEMPETPVLNDVILPEIGEEIIIDTFPSLKKEIDKSKVVELQRTSSPEKIIIDPTVLEPADHNIKESNESQECHLKHIDKQNECFQLQGNTSNEAENIQLVDKVVKPPVIEVKEQGKETNQEYNSSKESEDRRRKLEARYNTINNRFANILKFNDNKSRIIPKTNSQFELKDADISASSGELESFEEISLYHPSVDELDNVLIAYDKIIGGIARDSKLIDTFLSLPKFNEYRIVDDTTSQSSVSNNSLSKFTKLGNAKTAIARALSNNEREAKRMFDFKKPTHKTEIKDGSREVDPHQNRRIFDYKLNEGQKQSICNNVSDIPEVLYKDVRRIGHSSKRLREEQIKRKTERLRSISDRSDPTISPANSLSSDINGMEPSVDNEILNESSNSRKDISAESKDAQQRHSKCIKFDKTQKSDSLRQVLLSKGDSSDIINYFIGYLMEDKKRDIGNKITSNSKATEIDPIMIKNSFENCQNFMHNFESINDKDVVFKRMIAKLMDARSGSNAVKKDLVLELPSCSDASCGKNDAVLTAVESSQSNENIVTREISKNHCEFSETRVSNKVDASIINDGNLKQSNNQCALDSKNEENSIRSKINRTVSEVESLEDVSNITNGENHSKKTLENANSENQRSPSTNGNVEKNESDITKCKTSKETDVDRTHESKIIVCTEDETKNQNGCTENEKNLNEISTNIVDKDIAKENSRESGKLEVISAISVGSKKLELVDNETEIIEKPKHKTPNDPVKTDSDDSLKDCTPLESSVSSKNRATPLKTPEVRNENISFIQTKDTEECTKAKNECSSQVQKTEVVNQYEDKSKDSSPNEAHDCAQKNVNSKNSYCENVSSVKTDLSTETTATSGKDMHRDVLYSKLAASEVTHANENSGSSGHISHSKTSKIETSSDTSHSEGELYMSSSCSYSLGEVRILRRNDLIAQDTTECEQCVLVTKNMLTSVNDSPSTLAESIGEI